MIDIDALLKWHEALDRLYAVLESQKYYTN